jgi:hypothetical protein
MRQAKKSLLFWLAILPLLATSASLGKASPAAEAPVYLPLVLRPGAAQSVQAPVLKWQRGGCYSSWCETGWYSSPAVADLDGDGAPEVIGSAYSIVVLDGATGALVWRMASGHDRSEPSASSVGRTWPGIVAADLDADGDLEIVTAHGGGYVAVYDADGYFEPGWPQQPTGGPELRGLSAADLDGDGLLEVIATGAVSNPANTWVFSAAGDLLPGWPQLSDDSGYAHGVFNANAAAGDLDGDEEVELVVPSDVHYIAAYEPDGSQIPAHPMYGGKGWGKVGAWESLEVELRGWGTCESGDDRAERFRANFAHSAAAIADVDGNGVPEVVVTGNMYDCSGASYPSQFTTLFIFNADRSRFVSGPYDWSIPAVDTGAPLSEDYDLIENAQPNPVLADLDGDGKMEVLFASYDGRLHAFWLDRSEHGDWPFQVYDPAEGFFRFASEPAVADLNNDGEAEIIFASWVEKGHSATGKLHVLNYLGNPLHEIDLPFAFSGDWNGALAAPTLADIDGDPDLEVVLNTAASGLVAYDLPGTAGAQVLWGTGRGNQRRDGLAP